MLQTCWYFKNEHHPRVSYCYFSNEILWKLNWKFTSVKPPLHTLTRAAVTASGLHREASVTPSLSRHSAPTHPQGGWLSNSSPHVSIRKVSLVTTAAFSFQKAETNSPKANSQKSTFQTFPLIYLSECSTGIFSITDRDIRFMVSDCEMHREVHLNSSKQISAFLLEFFCCYWYFSWDCFGQCWPLLNTFEFKLGLLSTGWIYPQRHSKPPIKTHPEHGPSCLILVGSSSLVSVPLGSVKESWQQLSVQLVLEGPPGFHGLWENPHDSRPQPGPVCQPPGLIPTIGETGVGGHAHLPSLPLPLSMEEAGNGKYLLSQLPFHPGRLGEPVLQFTDHHTEIC